MNDNDYMRLVIGDAEKNERGRMRGNPLSNGCTWKVTHASKFMIVRWLRKLLGKQNDDKVNLALWLESGFPHARSARVVLRFTAPDVPDECKKIWSPFGLSYFTHRMDNAMVINIQMHRDLVVYPGTSNYLGIFELRWPHLTFASRGAPEFTLAYKIFSLDTEPEEGVLYGNIAWE